MLTLLSIIVAVLSAATFQACLLSLDAATRRSAAWWTLVVLSLGLLIGAGLFMSGLQLWVLAGVFFGPRVLWWLSSIVVGMRLSWWMASGNIRRLEKVDRYVSAALAKAEANAAEADDQGDDEARDTNPTAKAASRTS